MKQHILLLRQGFVRGALLDRWIWSMLVVFIVSMMLSTAIVQTSVVVLFVLWLWSLFVARRVRLVGTVFDIPVLVFAIARIISIATAADVGVSFRALYTEIFFYCTFFVLTDLFSRLTRDQMVSLLLLSFMAAAVTSTIGIAKVLFFHAPRAASVTSGYYSLGLYLSALCAVALFLGRDPEFFSARWLWGTLCVVLSAGILLTLNRIHWVTLSFSLLVAGVFRERKALLIAVVLGVLAVLLVPSLQSRFVQLIHLPSNLSDRDTLWKGAMMIAGVHPLTGFGPRSFHQIFPLFAELADKGVGGWHNDYLQVYMESGLMGLLAFLWIVGSVYVRGIGMLRRALRKDLVAGLLLGLTVFFLAGGVFDTVVSLLFWFLLALLALAIGEPENAVAPR